MKALLAGAVVVLAALLVAKQVEVVDLRLEVSDAHATLRDLKRWVES